METSSSSYNPRPLIGIGAMILRDGKVLLAKRKGALHGSATYGWIGGHLEFGETLEDCVIRNTYEKSGLVISDLELICVSNIVAYERHYVDVEFLATKVQGEPRRMKSTLSDWSWYDLDNLPSPLFKAVDLAIQSYKSGNKYNP